MVKTTEGNCYICGAKLGKTAMKNHILKLHNEIADIQDCYLLKIEGKYNKDYWLYIDAPINKTLSDIDAFLRDIWLECCGHMSAFYYSGYDAIKTTKKLNSFMPGDKIRHAYDFGSTTELLITFVAKIKRPRRKEAIRLLARNIPFHFTCHECGEPAQYILTECDYDMENPFYCKECAEKHELDDMMLPVTNSPRMGVCGYEGERDSYTFSADGIANKKTINTDKKSTEQTG